MEPTDEIVYLLKALKIVRQQLQDIVDEKDANTTRMFETYQRMANLSYCLELVCWRVFGSRSTDDMKHLLNKENEEG